MLFSLHHFIICRLIFSASCSSVLESVKKYLQAPQKYDQRVVVMHSTVAQRSYGVEKRWHVRIKHYEFCYFVVIFIIVTPYYYYVTKNYFNFVWITSSVHSKASIIEVR